MLRLLILLLLTTPAKAQDVYKTPSGAKYHLATCRMVKNVSEKITLTEAAKLGLAPCKICDLLLLQAPYKNLRMHRAKAAPYNAMATPKPETVAST